VLLQVIDVVAGVVEPAVGLTIDVWRRRPLLVVGAVGWAVALLLVAGWPSFAGLLAAFAVIGATSGALAHTADVVLIEGHPDSVDRISTLSTLVDSVGALLAPFAVWVLFASGGSWEALLVAVAAVVLAYAAVLARTPLPEPAHARRVAGERPAPLRRRVGRVVADREARRWLGVLVLDSVAEVAAAFTPVWLADEAGLSQALIGAHVTLELAAGLVGLVLVGVALKRWDGATVLRWSLGALLIAYPAWLLADDVAARFVLVVPRTIAAAAVWPIARGRALASVPGNAGTIGAVGAVASLLPLSVGFGWLGERVGFTTAMLVVPTTAVATMLLLVRHAPSTLDADRPA
jgi:MFS family permease